MQILGEDVLDGHARTPQPIPGWDGSAAERIASLLAERYGTRTR